MLNKAFDKLIVAVTSDKAMEIANHVVTIIVIALVIEGAKSVVNGVKAANENKAESTNEISE